MCRPILTIAFFAIFVVHLDRARACPYCTIESMTLTEEMAASDVAVIARLVKPAAPVTEGPDELGEFGVVDPETGRAKFRIERVLLGEPLLLGAEEIEAVYFGEVDYEKKFFIRAVGIEELDWNVPVPLTEIAVEYINQLEHLPEEGPERVAFFLGYLQHEDPLLAQDAYDEFARAPYVDVLGIADKIDREQLWRWIEDRDVSPNRRSLFFTLLGVCGGEEDRQRLKKIMLADDRVLRSAAEASAAAAMGLGGAITLPAAPEMVGMEQRRKQLGFNAMVGCYMKLGGERSLDEIDELFLAKPNAHPSKVYGTLLALRFMAEETDDVPLDRLIESMRLVLDKPDFAEQAITDLARWQDWTVLDRLATMFKEAKPRTYVKEPIVAYLDQARQQPGDVGARASAALEEIEKLDPETVKRSRSLMAFGFLGRARAAKPKTESTDETDNQSTDNDMLMFQENPAEEEESDSPLPEERAPELVVESDESIPTASEPGFVESALPRPLDMRWVLGLPLLVAGLLMALVWALLRGGV